MLVTLALTTTVAAADKLDRTVLPIPEPKPPVYTALDARGVKPPPRFDITAPAGAPNVLVITSYSIHYTKLYDFVGRYYAKQAALVGVTFAPVASYKVNEKFSVGGGPNIMVAHLKTTAMINNILPVGVGDGQLEVKDNTVGVGGQFGVLYEPKKGTSYNFV